MIKCKACRAFYHFFATCLINSIKHEHECKIPNILLIQRLVGIVFLLSVISAKQTHGYHREYLGACAHCHCQEFEKSSYNM